MKPSTSMLGIGNCLAASAIVVMTVASSLLAQVSVTDVRPNKLLYKLNESGTVAVTLVRSTSIASVRLVTSVESGIDSRAALADQTMPLTGDTTRVSIPLPAQSEYGHRVVAEVWQNSALIGSKSEWFYTSDRPQHVGHYGGFPSQNQIKYDPWFSVESGIDQVRATYATMMEFMFWAPDDCYMLVPPEGKTRWWSGQTLTRVSASTYKSIIKAGHDQGIGSIAYADFSVDYGWRVWDVVRKHPEFMDWDCMSPAYSVKNLRILNRENDAELDSIDKLGQAGSIFPQQTYPIGINSGLVKWHGDQLAASIAYFDWDGFRYDDPLWGMIDTRWDLLGRQMNTAPWAVNYETIIKYFRTRMEGAKTNAIYGHNLMWNQADNPDPAAKEASDTEFRPFVRDNGFALQEAATNTLYSSKWSWTDWATKTNKAGKNAYRYGGEQYLIIDWGGSNSSADERRYIAAYALAGGCHFAYTMADDAAYMRFCCRYCDLLFGNDRYFPAATSTVNVTASRTVQWQDYVRYRATSADKRTYYVHVINQPLTSAMGGGAVLPAAATNVQVTWQLPSGWTATKAYALSPEFGDSMRVPLTLSGSAVTVPQVKIWTIVAVECTGSGTDASPVFALPAVAPMDVTQPIIAKANDWTENKTLSITQQWATLSAQEIKSAQLDGEKANDTFSGPRVWFGNGLYGDFYKLDKAFSQNLGARVAMGDNEMKGFHGGKQCNWVTTPFPNSMPKMAKYDLLVLCNVPYYLPFNGFSFPDNYYAWIKGYVNDGGSLLMLGGPYGFGHGRWGQCSQITDILPITLTNTRDLQPVASTLVSGGGGFKYDPQIPPGAPIVNAGMLFTGLDWSSQPQAVYAHDCAAKQGATVQATVNGKPAIVTGTYGKGKVAVVTVAPLGEPSAGKTAFWDWSGWQMTMANLGGWLMDQQVVKVAPSDHKGMMSSGAPQIRLMKGRIEIKASDSHKYRIEVYDCSGKRLAGASIGPQKASATMAVQSRMVRIVRLRDETSGRSVDFRMAMVPR